MSRSQDRHEARQVVGLRRRGARCSCSDSFRFLQIWQPTCPWRHKRTRISNPRSFAQSELRRFTNYLQIWHVGSARYVSSRKKLVALHIKGLCVATITIEYNISEGLENPNTRQHIITYRRASMRSVNGDQHLGARRHRAFRPRCSKFRVIMQLRFWFQSFLIVCIPREFFIPEGHTTRVTQPRKPRPA